MLDTINIIMLAAVVFVVSLPSNDVVTWSETKKLIKYETLSLKDPVTLYGGCRISRNWVVNLRSCNFTFQGKDPKTSSIDMEHIVPVKRMMSYVGCGETDRQKCRSSNKKFRSCHNNRLNLYPAVSSINSYRGSKDFTEISAKDESYPFGEVVDFKVSKKGGSIEPPERSKIAVATAYFAMEKAECIKLSDKETITFSEWLLSH